MSNSIYLDYAATTPVDEHVANKMLQYMTVNGEFGNGASLHRYGQSSLKAVEAAREQVAELINADAREIVWTSGATESDNLAIKGVAEFHQHKGRHIITSQIEHKAVLDTCAYLESKGFEVTYLTPSSQGIISPEQVQQALRPETILVSLMHVNNELGVITDIEKIAQITRQHKVLFHVDAAQSAGKIAIDLQAMAVDLMSFSAHKIYGPKGMGALYVRRRPRARLHAQMHGGGHEGGLRSGTLAHHQIVGMGEAFAIAKQRMCDDAQQQLVLKKQLWQTLQQLGAVHLNGHWQQSVPGILNVSIEGVEGEALLMMLKDLAVSSGSACTSASIEPSYVLRAIGRSDQLAHSAIRFSVGRYTSQADMDRTCDLVNHVVTKLRSLSPLWLDE